MELTEQVLITYHKLGEKLKEIAHIALKRYPPTADSNFTPGLQMAVDEVEICEDANVVFVSWTQGVSYGNTKSGKVAYRFQRFLSCSEPLDTDTRKSANHISE